MERIAQRSLSAEGSVPLVQPPSLTAEPSIHQQLLIGLLLNAEGCAVWLLQAGPFLPMLHVDSEAGGGSGPETLNQS